MSGFLSKADAPGWTHLRTASDALVHQAGEQRRRYDELTPLGVERCGRLGGNRLIERAALLLELRDVVADRDKHLAIGRKFRLLLTGLPWPGMTIVLSVTAATFASVALIIPSMFPPVE